MHQGTLAQLDSQNPVMYLDFPTGRLKLFGTLVFPKNKYMVLRLGGSSVLAEDVFENMVGGAATAGVCEKKWLLELLYCRSKDWDGMDAHLQAY
jgi:hypothetical protein